MVWVKTPLWVQRLFPQMVWRISDPTPNIYLTFDDGPTPEVTPLVLDFLFKEKVKATFFCIGEQVEKHPEIADRIRKDGHLIANHGYLHWNGLFTKTKKFIENVERGARLTEHALFRPPYGKINPWQLKRLPKDIRVVMWDVMSMDFNPAISIHQCIKNVVDNASSGSVIVFHDNLKSKDRLMLILPEVIQFFKQKGYSFQILKQLP